MTPEQRARWLAGRTKHGGYAGGKESSTHAIWRTMIVRCTKPSTKSYRYYGGRGIGVCERWMDYANFLADMGERPPNMQLDRINNERGYEPGNCRWATASEQQKNRRDTKRYEFAGLLFTPSELAAHVGISRALLTWRMKNWGVPVK